MKPSRALVAGLVSILAAAIPSHAQEAADLFHVSDWPLGSDLLDGHLDHHEAVVEARAIEIDGAQLTAGRETLRFELFEGTRYEAVLNELERRGPEDVTWRGWLGAPGGDRVVLTSHEGRVAGMVFSPEGVYEIAPLAGGGHRLAQIDQDRFPLCGGAPEPLDLSMPFEGDVPAAADSADQIDVMIAYTPQARTAAGGTAAIRATAQSAVDMANTAFIDSGMVARFVLVSTILASRNDSGDMEADLYWLTSDAGIAAARDVARADMVGLLVQSGGGACGIGWVMRSPASWFASNAFQVTARSCAVGNLSYAHEHGHNMGMEHNPQNGAPSAQASYPWSFGHYVNGVFRTVMSYVDPCPNGCTRVARFSNPDLTYAGHPTGIANQRDNHRTGDLTAPIVANFRQRALGDFYSVTPCRLLDTRQTAALSSGVPLTLPTAGQCGLPLLPSALAVNVTVTDATSPGSVALQVGSAPATTTTVHFGAGQSRGNNHIIPVAADGSAALSIQPLLQSGGTVHVILDVSGYFN